MKAALMVAAVLLLAIPVALRADTVELGGFACLFGENLALLNLYQPASSAPITFTLSEGQAQYGIKLLQVDVTNHQAQIEQDGVKKYIRLCSAPDLSADSASPPVTNGENLTPEQQAILAQITNSEASKRILAGNPDLTFLSARSAGAGTAAKTGQGSSGSGTASGQPSSAGNGDGSTPASSSDSSSASITSQDWYQQSLILEQQRIATASDVLAGQADPVPFTPLTPPGTPNQLVANVAYFFNRNNTPSGFNRAATTAAPGIVGN